MPESIVDIARAALTEITTAESIGDVTSEVNEGDGAITVTFAAAMAGYPGWHWTVSLAHLDGEEPSVLETELMPGEGALLAPDWVPWSERLADWEAAQTAIAEAEAEAEGDVELEVELDDDLDDDDDDDDELDDELDDADEDDLLGSDVLHGGDLDGVEIEDPDEAEVSDFDGDPDEH
jgi:hypothetical protein